MGDCPLTSAGESADDCPWAAVARALVATPVPLRKLLPSFAKAVQADGKRPYVQGAWGQSINFDELAKAEIVPVPILLRLEDAFGVKGTASQTGKGYRVQHAGMEHTYGYILSDLKTAYGYKRSRWVSGEIERGLNLPAGLVGPAPSEGTLLSNATYLMGKIAFRKDPKQLAELSATFKKAPKALRDLDVAKLAIICLQEETADGHILRTDLVTFPTAQPDTRLLVYSVQSPGATEHAKLITAFPVQEDFVKMTLDPANLGDNQPIITRYNAYVAQITDAPQPLLGKRTRTDE